MEPVRPVTNLRYIRLSLPKIKLGYPLFSMASLCLLTVAVSPAYGQPPAHIPQADNNQARAVRKKAFADSQEYREFRKKLGNLDKTDPRKAVESYTEWLNTHPDLSLDVAESVYERLVSLQFYTLKDRPAALKLAEEGLAKTATASNSAGLLTLHMALLNAMSRHDETVKLGQRHWKIIIEQAVYGPLQRYTQALEVQGKIEEQTLALQQAIQQQPLWADPRSQGSTPWMYEKICGNLLASGHIDKALQWAKLHLVLCDIEDESLVAARATITKILSDKQAQDGALIAFEQSLKDDLVVSPLTPLALPVDSIIVQQSLESLAAPNNTTRTKVSFLLMLGDHRQAMSLAYQQWMEDTRWDASKQEVARILKASDLSLVRSNEFLNFARSGQGLNTALELLK
jgi:hypothetical protein